MERSRVLAATTSAIGAVAVGVCAIGLNIGVLRAGRSLHRVVVSGAGDPTPTSAELVFEDLVPLVIPLTPLSSGTPTDTATAEAPPSDAASSVEATTPSEAASPPPEAEHETESVTTAAASPPAPPTAPPPATSVTTAKAPAPGGDDGPGDDPTTPKPAPTTPTTHAATPTTAGATTSQTFTLPRQAGTATLAVSSTSLTMQTVHLASGWSYSCESPQGHEIQLALSGPGGQFEFTIKLENGHITTEGG